MSPIALFFLGLIFLLFAAAVIAPQVERKFFSSAGAGSGSDEDDE